MPEVKYRHPQNHDLAWTGKGRQPKWVEAYLDQGGQLADLLVDQVTQAMTQEGDGSIDLGIMDGAAAPTLAETLYAGRIASGDAPMPEDDSPSFTPGTRQALAAMQTEKSAVAGELVNPSQDIGVAEINQLIGQIQMANSFARFADVVSLQKLNHIKETKAYRASAGVTVKLPNGEIADVGTWAGFCQALGMSVSKVDEDLINLRAFGEEALENLTRIGAGYRELRQFRKLPPDQREALALIAKTGNRDDLLEAAYDAIEKERTAAQELQVKNAELAEDLKATERRAKNLDAECERKDSQIKRLTEAKKRTTEFLLRTEEIREECMALQLGAELNLNSLQKLFEEVRAEDPSLPEWRLQIEQIWVTAHVVAARALDMVERMKDSVRDGEMPERVMGQHILTPAEAQRWMLDYPMIENHHAADAAARQEKREAAKPKGPGRPKGSTNKTAAGE